jgi:putative peptide zinc metalloprotease protein
VAGQFFFIGVLLALWAIGAMIVMPVIKAIRHLAENPRMRRRRSQVTAIITALVVGLGGVFFLVPVPYHSHAEGVMWLPDDAMVRAGANGFLAEFLIQPGALVAKGDALIQCHEPGMSAQLRRGEAKVAELRAEYAAQFVVDRNKAQIVNEKLLGEEANLALVRERFAELTVRAKADGVFVAQQAVDMPGRYYRKGDLLGYVLGEAQPLARVVVLQQAIDKVRLATDRVRVRRVDQPRHVWSGKVLREVSGAGEYLPSSALSVDGGGEIAVDPRDSKGPKTLERTFQIDVELEDPDQVQHFGQRVYVRFEHQMQPLASQMYRSIRLLFLSSFNV